MQTGIVDLRRVGAHIVRRLLAAGHACVVFDHSPRLVAELAAERAYGAASLADLALELDAPRVIWITTPPEAVDATIADLRPHLEAGDIIVNCADSSYADDAERAANLARSRVHYVDVGLNGMPACPDRGYCLTVGGEAAIVEYLQPLFVELAARPDRAAAPASKGYLHCGPAGAGHFVHMVHNGIVHCLVAAYAEGFDILRAASAGRKNQRHALGARAVKPANSIHFEFNLPDIAEVWRNGSFVASPVLDAAVRLLAQDATTQAAAPKHRPRDGAWPAMTVAVQQGVSTPVLASAIYGAAGHCEDRELSNRLLTAMQQAAGDAIESRVR